MLIEAMASGCYPMGTYFAGMGANIDIAASAIDPQQAQYMRLGTMPNIGRGHRDERHRRPRAQGVIPQRAPRSSGRELRLGTHRPISFPDAAHTGRRSNRAHAT